MVGGTFVLKFMDSKTVNDSFQNVQWGDVDVTALRNSLPGCIVVELPLTLSNNLSTKRSNFAVYLEFSSLSLLSAV